MVLSQKAEQMNSSRLTEKMKLMQSSKEFLITSNKIDSEQIKAHQKMKKMKYSS